jgi:hypothetical protein
MGHLGSVLAEQAPGQVDKSYRHFLTKCLMGSSLDGHILRREAYPPRPRPYKELMSSMPSSPLRSGNTASCLCRTLDDTAADKGA